METLRIPITFLIRLSHEGNFLIPVLPCVTARNTSPLLCFYCYCFHISSKVHSVAIAPTEQGHNTVFISLDSDLCKVDRIKKSDMQKGEGKQNININKNSTTKSTELWQAHDIFLC